MSKHHLYDDLKRFLQEYQGAIAGAVVGDAGPDHLNVALADLYRLLRAFEAVDPPVDPWKGSTLREAAARLSRAIHPLVDGTKGTLNLYELHAAHGELMDVLLAPRDLTEPKPSSEDVEIVKLVAAHTVTMELLSAVRAASGFGCPSGPDVIEIIKDMERTLREQHDILGGARDERAKGVRALVEKLETQTTVGQNLLADLYQLANAGPVPGSEPTQAEQEEAHRVDMHLPEPDYDPDARLIELAEMGRKIETRNPTVPLDSNLRDVVDTIVYVVGGPNETVKFVFDALWHGVETSRDDRENPG